MANHVIHWEGVHTLECVSDCHMRGIKVDINPPQQLEQTSRWEISTTQCVVLSSPHGPDDSGTAASDLVEETLLEGQAPLMVVFMAEGNKESGAQVFQPLGLMALPPVAIILMRSTVHTG